ncbi:MAG: iron complex outermembrane receptor protein [Paraglaciecola sp.]
MSAVYGNDDFNFGVISSLNTWFGLSLQPEFDAGSLIYEQLTVNADLSRDVDVDFFITF